MTACKPSLLSEKPRSRHCWFCLERKYAGKKGVTIPLNIQGTLIGGLIIILSILLLFGLAKLNESQNANRLERKMIEIQLQRAVLSEIQLPDSSGTSIADREAYEFEKFWYTGVGGPKGIFLIELISPSKYDSIQHNICFYFPSVDGNIRVYSLK